MGTQAAWRQVITGAGTVAQRHWHICGRAPLLQGSLSLPEYPSMITQYGLGVLKGTRGVNAARMRPAAAVPKRPASGGPRLRLSQAAMGMYSVATVAAALLERWDSGYEGSST